MQGHSKLCLFISIENPLSCLHTVRLLDHQPSAALCFGCVSDFGRNPAKRRQVQVLHETNRSLADCNVFSNLTRAFIRTRQIWEKMNSSDAFNIFLWSDRFQAFSLPKTDPSALINPFTYCFHTSFQLNPFPEILQQQFGIQNQVPAI